MDLTGDTGNAGIQSDTFSTIVGQTYQVTFDAFNGSLKNNGGQVGVPYNGIAFTLQGTGGDLVGYTLPAGVPESLTYFFTASSTGSSVTFMDASGYDSNAGWIDNVNVSLVAAPEPSTFALFGGGLLLMGAILRSRRAKTAHCQ
jgi:hypothetical protein